MTKASFHWRLPAAFLLVIAAASTAYAQSAPEPPKLDTGDTAWLLMSTALVIMMTAPGLALFYGGLVRRINFLSTLMHSVFALCLISVAWVLWGYTLSFGTDVAGLTGGLNFLFFRGVGQEGAPLAATIPHLLFAMYQGAFAVITVALISGAYAERIRFPAYILFSLLWLTIVYAPLAHWVWGGGWIQQFGALDFAGGTVVHISSGVSALVAALIIGKRYNYPRQVFPPHNLGMTVIGAALLWFGWFGFNVGSALAANGLAALAFATTHSAAAAGGLGWIAVEWIHRGKPTVLGVVSGVVAGLVAITPGAGFVTVPSALIMGLGGGAICYLGVNWLKPRFGYDDALDVFGVHGLGGTWGALATGIFSAKAVNPAGDDGLLHGNASQLTEQIAGVLGAAGLAAIATAAILYALKAVMDLRPSKDDELMGLDLSVHGEDAYSYLASSGAGMMHRSGHGDEG
ncbi:MAG: Ammonium transporter [Myxococcota bacterium]|nr:Ammonium transporter [Myxococcota bacterium]